MHNEYIAKGARAGGFSGGRSSFGGSRSSSKSSSSSKSTKTTKKTETKTKKTTTKTHTTKKATPKATAAPKSAPKTKVATAMPTNKHYSHSKGVIGQHGYTPRFHGGYHPPHGSHVYSREHDFTDYLLLAYIFNQDSPAHENVIVVQPDGKQVEAQPEKGVDGLMIFNWFILIVIALSIIGGIVWFVNKKTQPKHKPVIDDSRNWRGYDI